MKRNSAVLLILAGLAAGWWLPVGRPGAAPMQDRTALSSTGKEDGRRAMRKQELLKRLLDDDEYSQHAKNNARSLSAFLPLLGRGHSGDVDIDRIVDLDPLAATDYFLSNPVASRELGEEVAAAWARKEPEKTIRYLWTKSSYRADDYLAAALTVGYPKHPELVGEVIRSKPRRWQELYLETLFKSSYSVRKPGAPPQVESDEPFADDGFWITRKFGEDILHCLADDELRQKARKYWEDDAPDEEPAKSEEEVTVLDPANYDPENWRQRDPLRKALRESPDETVAAIAEKGDYFVRKSVMSDLIGNFPSDAKEWPAALENLEARMNQLGVIPEHQPSSYHDGPFLRGPEVAAWIDRQPLALRRAWSKTFVQTWVTTEPAAALDWASSLPEAAARDEAFQSGLVIWTHRDPPAAIAAVEALPPGELRESAISNAAATWATLDRTGASAWLASLPESAGKRRALDRLK